MCPKLDRHLGFVTFGITMQTWVKNQGKSLMRQNSLAKSKIDCSTKSQELVVSKYVWLSPFALAPLNEGYKYFHQKNESTRKKGFITLSLSLSFLVGFFWIGGDERFSYAQRLFSPTLVFLLRQEVTPFNPPSNDCLEVRRLVCRLSRWVLQLFVEGDGDWRKWRTTSTQPLLTLDEALEAWGRLPCSLFRRTKLREQR